MQVQSNVIVDNSIYKPYISIKSFPVYVTQMDTGVSYEFASIAKSAEFLEVTISFLADVLEKVKFVKGIASY